MRTDGKSITLPVGLYGVSTAEQGNSGLGLGRGRRQPVRSPQPKPGR
jgi:hypothetical protein